MKSASRSDPVSAEGAANPRRAVALALVVLALALLVGSALRLDAPLGTSLSLARKFWSANRTTRLLNSPAFRADAAFVKDVLAERDRIPLASDVLLVLSPSADGRLADERRRRAAYLLAPRRVIVRRDALAPGREWSLTAVPASDPKLAKQPAGDDQRR